RGVEQVRGARNIDTEPSGLGDAEDEALQNLNTFVYHSGGSSDGRGAVLQRERVGVGKVELDMEIPPSPQILDRVVRKCASRLLAHVAGERLASGHVEQSLHVAEVAIDRRRLNPGRSTHGSRGYRAASALGEQFSGGTYDAGPSVLTIPR